VAVAAPNATVGVPAGRAAAHPNLVLAICCMSLLLVGMDVTIVNVALPAMEADLHAAFQELQWVLDAYTLVVASFLMLVGSLSDRFGRRRTFQVGLGVFGTGSVLCSLAHGAGQLVAFRAVQGLGASMLNPVALSIVANAFKEPAARARAVGVWGAVGGVSFAVGPLLGGFLTETVGWRAIFWVNVPLAVLAMVLAARFVPESKAARPRAFDPAGQGWVLLALASLTYAVIEGPRRGWEAPEIVGLFAVSAVAWAGLLWWERRVREPLIDLRFFRSVPFASATVLGVCAFSSFAAFLFLNALYLQHVRGLSAFRTGLYTLPLAAMMIVCSTLSGRMVGALGTRPSLLISGVGFMASTAMLAVLTPSTPLPLLLVVYALFGVGLGMVNPAISNSAVAGMPLAQAGVAAAIASTGRQVGAALGVAVAGTVVSVARSHGVDFTRATHPVFWGEVVSGAVVFALGWFSNTRWAAATAERVAGLLVEG
jgi:EmrB/QacA subfamily drug resistance transporter